MRYYRKKPDFAIQYGSHAGYTSPMMDERVKRIGLNAHQ